MGDSVASYLHKKFKKQLSLGPNTTQQQQQQNQLETIETNQNVVAVISGCCDEKNNNETKLDNNKIDNIEKTDVPNSSTNTIYNKSSISVIEQDENHSISSNIVPQQNGPHFDNNKFIQIKSSSTNKMDDETNQQSDTTTTATATTTTKNEENLIQRHPNGKYVCTYCNLVCSKPSVLQKHIRAHTNERPYPCHSCGFSFKTRSNLYKHCRSRTHANRVMGNTQKEPEQNQPSTTGSGDTKPMNKPYKPRFHTKSLFETNSKENFEHNNEPIPPPPPSTHHSNDLLTHHINEIINKNNTIVNNGSGSDEPLNLTNKRKRCMSEVQTEPLIGNKSLIKELLLKNLHSDMQCQYCKMIFQTVTELELHKLRSCKGKPLGGGLKYTRSSSVNVASILTQNKNAFDNIPQFQNVAFPLSSPGPFLGKTRLVDSDKTKSFSFDGLSLTSSSSSSPLLSPFDKEKRPPVKLFGGEVKITPPTTQTTTGRDLKHSALHKSATESGTTSDLSENRVIKSGLQSGGTVLTNKTVKDGQQTDVIRVYESTSVSPTINIQHLTGNKQHFSFDSGNNSNIIDFSQNALKLLTPNLKQPTTLDLARPIPPIVVTSHNNNSNNVDADRVKVNLMDVDTDLPQNLSNKDVEMDVSVLPAKKPIVLPKKVIREPINTSFYTKPRHFLVNGKVVRHVPGIPGPLATEEPMDMLPSPGKSDDSLKIQKKFDSLEIKTEPGAKSPMKQPNSPPKSSPITKKFARPNSLALKPTSASLKQHHGLTPTMFNQILISPDTPRVAKKYAQHFLHGNYFSYLGLKSSTKPTYCTLNKTQPFYVPHFKKLSMYSEWRQQDTKTDKMYASRYDSRQKNQRYCMAGKTNANLIMHSSYKFIVSDKADKSNDQQKSIQIPGGYESYEDYTYIRGRGRGRYVCHQCGIRCKKPSMLKKHIRTHSNDRPYTCNHCNFSFKTKGNLTKHMKSKAHTKNYAANSSGSGNISSSSSSTQQSGTQSSESDTEDSGMDSSDESTRQQEHEAAYGLLSLSQKTNATTTTASPLSPQPDVLMSNEEIVQVSNRNYVKNKIMDDNSLNFTAMHLNNDLTMNSDTDSMDKTNLTQFLGKTNLIRPLTYPYTSVLTDVKPKIVSEPQSAVVVDGEKNIKQFHVIQKYALEAPHTVNLVKEMKNFDTGANNRMVIVKNTAPTLKVNGVVVSEQQQQDMRKRKFNVGDAFGNSKMQKNGEKQVSEEEVMDLSKTPTNHKMVILNYLEDTNKSNPINVNYVVQNNNTKTGQEVVHKPLAPLPPPQQYEYDNSAMETLADIAVKQVKLEKDTLAKSVASEYLKLATNNYNTPPSPQLLHHTNSKDAVSEFIVKPEGNKSCTICAKSFNKPSQLRLHMNVHYLERPFRCDSCAVSFRTKGHLQKHERSASHHNKLSTSPALSSSEPRPFKCTECNIAFRIHGHLAKHLRSKMHIMKLECLAKIPFGLYAELERSNSLTEINTCDGDQCLESLKTLAKKVFINADVDADS